MALRLDLMEPSGLPSQLAIRLGVSLPLGFSLSTRFRPPAQGQALSRKVQMEISGLPREPLFTLAVLLLQELLPSFPCLAVIPLQISLREDRMALSGLQSSRATRLDAFLPRALSPSSLF